MARAEVVEAQLCRALGMGVAVTVAKDYEQMSQALSRGEPDLAWAPATIFERYRPYAQFAFRSSRLFGANQRSALVARVDAGLTTSMLKGKRAAWVDPHSNSGCLMVKQWLKSQSVDIDSVLVEQVFTGSFADSVERVLSREADITAVFVHGKSGTDFARSLEEIHAGSAKHLEPLAYTDPLPADGLLIGRRLPREVAVSLCALLSAPGDPTCLRSVCNVENFIAV